MKWENRRYIIIKHLQNNTITNKIVINRICLKTLLLTLESIVPAERTFLENAEMILPTWQYM